jgi:hypothetical protein
MRFPFFAFVGMLSVTAGAVSACGSSSSTTNAAGSVGSSGAGGAGGGASAGGATSSSSTAASSSSGAPDAGADVDNGAPSTVYPAPHPPAPQVVDLGGPVVAAPVLVPVFFPSEIPSTQASITDYVANIGASPYWTAVTSEYGIGPATSGTPVVLTEAAPSMIDDSAIQTWLAGKLNANDPAWPAATANTIYLIQYPAGTGVTLEGQASCSDFGGYHNSTTLDATHGNLPVAYAVLPRCDSFGPLMGINAITGPESHEIIEASTDPYPMNDPAYLYPDNADIYWLLALGGGEVGDMCAQFPRAFTKFVGLNYEVQRTWSNASAAASHDPCVPEIPGEVYFNAAPVLPDSISIQGLGTMKGVKIPIGQTKTIEVDLFSDGDTSGAWDVEVQDFNSLMGEAPTLQLSLDRNSGQNGEKLHLTITPMKAGQYGISIFLLTSSSDGFQNWWLGAVGD